MGIERFFVQPCTILHPATVTDAYNNLTDDWDNVTSTATKGWVSRTQTLEVLEDRDAQVKGALLYLPAGTNIGPTDRVVIGTTTYEVDGPPNPCPIPRTPSHHLEVQLQSVIG